jgi:ribosome biogenesis GTPase A
MIVKKKSPAKKFKKEKVASKFKQKKGDDDLDQEAEEAGINFNWFPGHMRKASDDIKERLNRVDLVLEVRDARAPTVTGNPLLKEIIGDKCHLILLNKANLADPEKLALWERWFKAQSDPYLFINCMDKAAMKLVVSYARKIIEQKHLTANPNTPLGKRKFSFMVVGLPNTGKSTIINQLAGRQATKAANKPGQTRVQLKVKIDDGLELMDTPGIMPPKIFKEEHKLWLGALNAIPDGILEAEGPACFLIQYFLQEKSMAFSSRYQLSSFELSVDEVLIKIAQQRGCLRQKGMPDLERVYKLILIDFHNGDLGKTCFEIPTF